MCAVISVYSLMMALMCILSHASYISDIWNINIFIFVEHQDIGLDALYQHNIIYMTDINECMQLSLISAGI